MHSSSIICKIRNFHDLFLLKQLPELVGYELPSGPWESDDAALAEIKIFALDPHLGGGIWGARFQAGPECKGTTRRIGCSYAHDQARRGTQDRKERRGCRCRWGITLKRDLGSPEQPLWRIKSVRVEHSHELEQDVSRTLLGQKSTRAGIPAEYAIVGRAMQRAGIEAAKIHNTLMIDAQHHGKAITWSYQDVRHAFGLTTHDRVMDASTLHEWIRFRSSTQGLEGAVLERGGKAYITLM